MQITIDVRRALVVAPAVAATAAGFLLLAGDDSASGGTAKATPSVLAYGTVNASRGTSRLIQKQSSRVAGIGNIGGGGPRICIRLASSISKARLERSTIQVTPVGPSAEILSSGLLTGGGPCDGGFFVIPGENGSSREVSFSFAVFGPSR